ncbi:MAG: GNAT family N-acetyltransferase [Asgard group archaeon]|nr:GNAT family N-acetyltransferase [Asgard group archaeon]
MPLKKQVLLSEQDAIFLKKSPFYNIFSFTQLNLYIHRNDPLFKKAQQTFLRRIKFFFHFLWKALFQARFVVVKEGKSIGALALEKKKLSIFIYAIGLLEDYRRKGIGTKLMEFTEEYAKKKKKKYVTFSVLLENTPAISFYRKLDYHSLGAGLTLFRIHYEKSIFETSVEKYSLDDFELQGIYSKYKYKKIINFWWAKEIEYAIGKNAKNLAQKDNFLEFEYNSNWLLYEIFFKNNAVGFIGYITRSYFPTFVLFSNPKNTWEMSWVCSLYTYIKKQIFEQKTRIRTLHNITINTIPDNRSIFQLFITHQHMEALKKSTSDIFSVHDKVEDRQIMYKKIN